MKRIDDNRSVPDTVDPAILEAWARRLEQLRAEYDTALGQANDAQRQVNDLNRTRDQLQTELQSLLTQIPGIESVIATTRSQEAALSAQLDEHHAARDAATARLLGTERADGTVQTKHPLLLLPVRLETRFLPARDSSGPELRIRVYPDDVHIDTHELGLTEEEDRWGKHFWQQAGAGSAGDETRGAAWQQLVERFGSTRAAWISRVLDPAKPITIPRRKEMWNRAAHTRTLPDRWVAVGYREDRPVVTTWGKPIPDPLATGPSPALQEGAVTDGRDLPAIDEGMRWMIDFDSAEAKGMALRIPLSADQARRGFERLVVMGIKASVDAEATSARLAELLEAHHYTTGIAIAAQNIPTNNTAEASSGYSSTGDGSGSDAIELGKSLLTAGSDGEIAAHALGVAPVAFSHIRDAGGSEQRHARAINAALWGNLDSPLLRQLRAAVDPEFLRTHFIDFVRARGSLPVLRVGSQPYGLLPVAAVDRWTTADNGRGERALADWWRACRPTWRVHATRALSLGQDHNPFTMLGHEANGCHYTLHAPDAGPTPQRAPRTLTSAALRDLLLGQALQKLGDSSFDFLRALPDEIRQPLIAEVLDLATFRFDAWAVSLASRRLSELRRENPSGIRVGAYGWVEDLRPAAPLQLVSPLPAHTIGPLHRSDANKGFVHAPSLAHAATAAVLRSGYLSDLQKGDGVDSPLAVNLSSDRVHRAKWLLDGVRQGQPLAALLGYRFERSLHEHGLDRYVHRFRTLASLKDDSALAQAYDTVNKAEQLAKEVSALYQQRDQVAQRAQEAQAVTSERRKRRQSYQDELDAIARLEQQANAAAAEIPQLDRSIAAHRAARPRSVIDVNGRRYQVELVEEVDLEPWTVRLQQLLQARQAAQHREATARSGFNARVGARAVALAEIATLDNQPANPNSIVAAQQAADLDTAQANAIDREAVAREGGTRGGAEQALTAARRELATQLNRQWEQALESLVANSVVDGLELHRRWKAGRRRPAPQNPWDATTIPFGDAALGFPGAGTDDFKALDAQLQALDEWVDAVGDTVVAESVYQIVQGNPLRSGATLDAIASGEMPPPELEVVRTPRTGIALTHRLLAAFPVTAGVAPATWPISEYQVRAQAEPLLNAWVATLLPRPSQVRCKAEYVDPKSGTVRRRAEVVLSALKLSPLDAIYLAEGQALAQRTEVEQRLVFHLLRNRPAAVSADVDVRLVFARDPGWASGVISLGEFLEMARTVRKLVASARALDARDLALPGGSTATGFNTEELTQRSDRAVQAFQEARQALLQLLPVTPTAADATVVDLEALRQVLLRVASFGVQGCVPLAAVGESPEARKTLLAQAGSIAKELEGRLSRISSLAATFDVTRAAPDARHDYDMARLKEIFGADFRVMPQLIPVNATALNTAFRASVALQGGDPLAAVTWFQRAAYVREGVARLDATMRYAEISGNGAALSLQVGQLPFSSSDRWVALPVPPTQTVPGGRLSLVAHMPLSGEPRFDRAVAGLMIDEWVEVVPSGRETTGLTFHCDQSNSAAPQSILVAVPSDRRPVWDLNSLETVLRDTLDLARMRAVAPDLRAETVWVGDDLPAGAIPTGQGDAWTWVRLNPKPISGKAAHQSAIVAGLHQHFFHGATATLSVSVGDRLFAYVYLDPLNTPRELMLQWNDGSWEHRAYWGENLIEWGTNGTASRQFMGALPRAGCWVRLEVPAVTVGLEGREVNGMSFVLWDGRATWDAAGLITRQPMNAATTERFAPSLFFDGGVDFSSALDAVAEE